MDSSKYDIITWLCLNSTGRFITLHSVATLETKGKVGKYVKTDIRWNRILKPDYLLWYIILLTSPTKFDEIIIPGLDT